MTKAKQCSLQNDYKLNEPHPPREDFFPIKIKEWLAIFNLSIFPCVESLVVQTIWFLGHFTPPSYKMEKSTRLFQITIKLVVQHLWTNITLPIVPKFTRGSTFVAICSYSYFLIWQNNGAALFNSLEDFKPLLPLKSWNSAWLFTVARYLQIFCLIRHRIPGVTESVRKSAV